MSRASGVLGKEGSLIDKQTRQSMLQDPRYQKYEKYGD